jgi:hypothetical protein
MHCVLLRKPCRVRSSLALTPNFVLLQCAAARPREAEMSSATSSVSARRRRFSSTQLEGLFTVGVPDLGLNPEGEESGGDGGEEEAGEALVFAKLRETNAAPGETPVIVAMLLFFFCLTVAGASAVSLSARAHGADNTLAKRSTSCFTARANLRVCKINRISRPAFGLLCLLAREAWLYVRARFVASLRYRERPAGGGGRPPSLEHAAHARVRG